ncbi:hypothetical protein Q8A67_010247 [Cirrhinus molitorella]|uniref:Uncharacterized protein n=1 Tax=Cirrhinus molitorella TaxID=172907 RepID=A0AA88TN99_9TELE|nr:hypothetical protein Q8A67_010247 [Cirrhinus molitorella]
MNDSVFKEAFASTGRCLRGKCRGRITGSAGRNISRCKSDRQEVPRSSRCPRVHCVPVGLDQEARSS